MSHFEIALDHVIKAEGGFVDNKNDRGGWTKYGVTRATLETFRGRTVIREDVEQLTLSEAKEIYRVFYWEPNGLERIQNPMLAIMLFDQVVNRRASEVIRGLQQVLNESFGMGLKIDGVFGAKTADCLNTLKPEKLLVKLCIQAQASYFAIVDRSPSQSVFIKGWIARTWRLLELI